jgi:hypothetical protein
MVDNQSCRRGIDVRTLRISVAFLKFARREIGRMIL